MESSQGKSFSCNERHKDWRLYTLRHPLSLDSEGKLWFFFMLSASDSDFGVSIKLRDSQIMLAITVTMKLLWRDGGEEMSRSGSKVDPVTLVRAWKSIEFSLSTPKSDFYRIQTFIAWFVLSVSVEETLRQVSTDFRGEIERKQTAKHTHSSDVLVCITTIHTTASQPCDDKHEKWNRKKKSKSKASAKWNVEQHTRKILNVPSFSAASSFSSPLESSRTELLGLFALLKEETAVSDVIQFSFEEIYVFAPSLGIFRRRRRPCLRLCLCCSLSDDPSRWHTHTRARELARPIGGSPRTVFV